MARKTVVAHVPCNFAGPQFRALLETLKWTDALVIQDASFDGSVSIAARLIDPRAICIRDQDSDLRTRLTNCKDKTDHDFILWAHSDETWGGRVKEEILNFLQDPGDFEGGIIEHESFGFGVSFGIGWPQQRLIKRDVFYFDTESVHEMPKVPGRSKIFKSHYNHYPNQNMLLNWVKNYKYMVTEGINSSESIRGKIWANDHSIRLLSFIKYWLRINFHFLRGVWQGRKLGFAGLSMAHNQMIRIIVSEMATAEAVRMLDRGETYETAGHFEMPLLPVKKAVKGQS